MKTLNTPRLRTNTAPRRLAAIILIACIAGFSALPRAQAQAQPAHQPSAVSAPAGGAEVMRSLSELRDKVARLEAEVQKHQTHPAAPGAGAAGMSMNTPAKPPMSGMSSGGMGMMDMDGMKGGGMGMGMDKMKMMNMGAGGGAGASMAPMPGGGMSMMDMMGMMKGMDMMGTMGGMQGMNAPSALPGFPGASHLYHIGATGFFLDHPRHITLTTAQQTALNQAKEQAALAKNTSDRQMEQAEQELWELTSADQPDAAKIEAKVRDIEKLRSDARLAFIRSVGEAAKILTDDQRKVLVGETQPGGQAGGPAHQHKP
jgi:Spy/CpxP family protein refolding chaperone